MGTLSLSNVDYVARQLVARPRPQFVIFDFRRVTSMTPAGARLLAEEFRELAAYHVTVIVSGIKRADPEWKPIADETGNLPNMRYYFLLDAAIEWAEDQVVFRHGGSIDFFETTELSEQPLLAGLTDEELTDLAALGDDQDLSAGRKDHRHRRSRHLAVLSPQRRGPRHPARRHPAGDADGRHGVRRNGVAGAHRSADVLADAAATAFEVPLGEFERFRKQHPHAGERIMRNLAQLLADRLILANAKVNLLTSG